MLHTEGEKYSVRTGPVPPGIMEYHMFQHKLAMNLIQILFSPNANPQNVLGAATVTVWCLD